MRLEASGSPSVSILVTTYNQAACIEATVRSALAQTYPYCEVIVVDDGSTDGTGARLVPFLNEIQYIYQKNKGVAGSRNTAVRHARGELIAFLDGDDLWEPEKIGVQVAAYQAHPCSGLVVVDARSFGGSTIRRQTTLPWKEEWLSCTLKGGLATGRFYRELIEGNFICTISQAMIPRRVLEKIGFSDESLAVSSDYDLYLRIAASYDITFVNRVLTSWRYLPTSASGPVELRGLRYLFDDVAILKKHRFSAAPMWRSFIRQIGRQKLFVAAQTAYYFGCDTDTGWAARYLTKLWARNPTELWPLVFFLGLSSPPAVRRTFGATFRRLRLLGSGVIAR